MVASVNVGRLAALQRQWLSLPYDLTNIDMFLLSYEASDEDMVLDPSMISMMLGYMTSIWFFSS